MGSKQPQHPPPGLQKPPAPPPPPPPRRPDGGRQHDVLYIRPGRELLEAVNAAAIEDGVSINRWVVAKLQEAIDAR